MTTSLLASFLKVLATLVVVVVCRKIDLFEKEPWKALFLGVAFGVPAYFLSLAITQMLFHVFSVSPDVYSLGRIVCLLVASAIVQVVALILAMALFAKSQGSELDSLPDYILYSVSISCGYAIGSLLLQYSLEASSSGWAQDVINSLYEGPALMDVNIPFVSAGIGIILFLVVNRRVIRLRIGSIAIALAVGILVAILQSVFIVGGLLSTLGRPDTLNAARSLGEAMIEFSSTFSTVFILVAVTLGAMLDLNIVVSFVDKVFDEIAQDGSVPVAEEARRLRKVFSNPVSYSSFLRAFLRPSSQRSQSVVVVSSQEARVARSIAGLALNSWKRPEAAATCIAEGKSLIVQCNS